MEELWREVVIGDLCEGIFDGPHATPKKTAEGPLFLGISSLKDGRIDLSESAHLSEEDFVRWTRRVEPRPGDIVFSYETRLGQAAIIPDGLRCCLGRRMALMRPDRSEVDPRFLLMAFLGREFQDTIRARTVHGSTVERILLEEFPRFPIRVPSLAQQRAIARVLGALDDKIELNRQMNRTLEAMAQALFKSWFVDFDPVVAKAAGRQPFGVDAETAALFPSRFVESELGSIPDSWRVAVLGDVAEHPRRGVEPSAIDASTPYIALEHMPRRCIALSEWGTAGGLESNKFTFRKGEILFGKLRPYFHKVGVAPVDGVCSTDIVVLTARSKNWFGFVFGHVSSDAFVEHTNAGSTGTKMPRTSWADMARFPVALPPDAIAAAFTERVGHAVSQILASIHESRTLAALRNALLPKLLSGEVRVHDAEKAIEGRLA